MQAVRTQPGHRLNVLLTDAEDRWVTQLPRLLEPQGVRAIRVGDVGQAVSVIETEPIHAAVVDLAMPMALGSKPAESPNDSGGLKLLRVIQRLQPVPPIVVVRGRSFDRRIDSRTLHEALKLDAFSVVDQPVELEQLLEVLRRLIQRFYGGAWPTQTQS